MSVCYRFTSERKSVGIRQIEISNVEESYDGGDDKSFIWYQWVVDEELSLASLLTILLDPRVASGSDLAQW